MVTLNDSTAKAIAECLKTLNSLDLEYAHTDEQQRDEWVEALTPNRYRGELVPEDGALKPLRDMKPEDFSEPTVKIYPGVG